MTDADLRALLDAATKGPWKTRRGFHDDEEEIYPAEVDGKKRPAVGQWAEFAVVSRRPAAERKANARLIAAAPDLAAEVLRLRAESARLRDAVDYAKTRFGLIRDECLTGQSYALGDRCYEHATLGLSKVFAALGDAP